MSKGFDDYLAKPRCACCYSAFEYAGKGKTVFGRDYCTKCSSGRSDRGVLEVHLAREEDDLAVYSRLLEDQKKRIATLRTDIPKAKKQRSMHLQPIQSCAGLTSEQKRAIRQGLSFNETWESREKLLKSIREEHDRKARIEVMYLSNEKKYRINVFKGNCLAEVVTLPVWNKLGVKRLIDNDESIKVPWKQITSGQTWSAEIEISPYYIEKTWVPNNVVPFARKIASAEGQRCLFKPL